VKVVLGPETSSADASAFTARFGIPVIEGYGSSEGVIRMVPVGGHPGALGRPDPDADVAVVDPDTLLECAVARFDDAGRLVNAGDAIGEIVRRDGVSRFEGYYANDEANAARTRNGWFWSGDLGYRDEDGIFWFAGRDLDWIRVDGENFAAAPVERIVARHPDVAGVAVFGVPDPTTGDEVMVAVVLRPGRSFDAAGFDAFLAEQADLGTKWSPRYVRVVDALPVTGTNKIDKKPLRAQAWSGGGDVWWRRRPRGALVPFDAAEDGAALRGAFEASRRSDLLPRPATGR
jgi:fatty-acyl-CoA synthase